jgi:hypothetical protein
MEWESSERQIEMKERILQLVREQQDQVEFFISFFFFYSSPFSFFCRNYEQCCFGSETQNKWVDKQVRGQKNFRPLTCLKIHVKRTTYALRKT